MVISRVVPDNSLGVFGWALMVVELKMIENVLFSHYLGQLLLRIEWKVLLDNSWQGLFDGESQHQL